jgi:hypothetical protein
MILKWLKTKFTILTNQNRIYITTLVRLLLLFLFLDNGKKVKSLPLSPIAVEILISRGSAYKIVTESGTMLTKMPNLSASN